MKTKQTKSREEELDERYRKAVFWRTTYIAAPTLIVSAVMLIFGLVYDSSDALIWSAMCLTMSLTTYLVSRDSS